MDVIVTSTGVVTRGERPMVLVVDDETSLRELLRRWLLRAGYDVADAGNGDDAIARLSLLSDRIALVLTDLDMPGMRGEALIAHVRERWPGLPVLVLTGGCERVPSVPVGDHLDKPIHREHLIQAVADALGGELEARGQQPVETGHVAAGEHDLASCTSDADTDDVDTVTIDVDDLLDIED